MSKGEMDELKNAIFIVDYDNNLLGFYNEQYQTIMYLMHTQTEAFNIKK
ncbi:MAG: hypothetical protein ACFFDN_28865 [Candidatus Hodarchaeota archaeon]